MDLFKFFRSPSPARRLKSYRPEHKTYLQVEQLDERLVPTVTATFTASTSTLAVQGDNVANEIRIEQYSAGGLVAEPVQIVGGKPAASVPASQSTPMLLQNGLAPQYMVVLANQLDADPWFNMPHVTDDDYVRK